MSLEHTHIKEIPSWAKRPETEHMTCAICGKVVYAHEEYEAVKPKGAKVPNFYHTTCIKKGRTK